jgi:plastocyanin
MFDAGDAMRQRCKIMRWLVFFVACIGGANIRAQENSVSLRVMIAPAAASNAKTPLRKVPDASNVVVWLTPLDRTAASISSRAPAEKQPQIVQRNKTFAPHLLVVPVGTMVQFPNKDPFFHNIFSLYDGKRFDLGLYESGSARSVSFDRPGVSFLFCNIHAQMSAVVVAVDTPYFGVSDRSGNVLIRDVPNGRYHLNVWYERSLPEQLRELNREVTISDSARSFGLIHILENPNFTAAHKNKYGLDYVRPPNPDYNHP